MRTSQYDHLLVPVVWPALFSCRAFWVSRTNSSEQVPASIKKTCNVQGIQTSKKSQSMSCRCYKNCQRDFKNLMFLRSRNFHSIFLTILNQVIETNPNYMGPSPMYKAIKLKNVNITNVKISVCTNFKFLAPLTSIVVIYHELELETMNFEFMQNLFSFQTPFKFSKSIHWLLRCNICRKRPF